MFNELKNYGDGKNVNLRSRPNKINEIRIKYGMSPVETTNDSHGPDTIIVKNQCKLADIVPVQQISKKQISERSKNGKIFS